MDMPMKAQPSVQTTSTTPAHAPPTTTAGAYAAPAANAQVDHIPRALRWLQSFLAGVIAALSIGANVGFHNLLARDDLVGGDGYVAALVIPVVVAVFTIIALCFKPVPARLVAEYVAIPLWLLAAVFLAAESAIVMNQSCYYTCIYIYGAGPNAGCAAAGLSFVEVGLFCYSAYRGRQVRTGGAGRELGGAYV